MLDIKKSEKKCTIRHNMLDSIIKINELSTGIDVGDSKSQH